MKIKFYCFILYFSIAGFIYTKAQIKKFDSAYITKIEKTAIGFENGKNYENAMLQYAYLKRIDSSGKAGKNAERKVTQLLPICQRDIYNILEGKWVIKQNIEDENSVLKSTKTLEIKDNLITFRDTQKILFEYSLDTHPLFINLFGEFPSLKINNEIWTLSFREINQEKRVIWMKKIDKKRKFSRND